MNAPRVLCANSYLPYPHTNPFLDDHHVLVVQSAGDISRIVDVCLAGGSAGCERVIAELTAGSEANTHVIFDVARNVLQLALIYANAVYLLDPRESYSALPNPIYRSTDGAKLYSIPSIKADGTRIVILEEAGGVSVLREIDVASGQVKTLMAKNWLVGHAHYVPGDEDWIAFCHEGPTEKIPDRVWVWHAVKAPEGKCVFDQKSDDPKLFLNVGHERWGFAEASGLVVAYGCSPAGPRGLWQVFADGRPARQVFRNDRCWHCDISRDARYALADTTGTWDLPGCGWQDDDKNRSILLIDMATGKHVVLGSAGGDRHPYHPHPVFSPDGRYVLFNTKRGDEKAVMIVETDEAVRSLQM